MKNSKKAIIIGASSGIGEALAETLVKDGYKVGITGRREDRLLEIKDKYPDNIIVSSFDISNCVYSKKCIDHLLEKLGGIDLFIFCSGIGATNKYFNFQIDYKVIRVNIIGFTNAITHIYKYMMEQGHGHIVNVSSVAGLRGHHSHAAYHSTKSYQSKYIESLRQKCVIQHCNIKVTDIRPGFIQTDFISKRPALMVSSLTKAVRQMYHAIKMQRKVVYVSRRYIIIAFLMKIFPAYLYDRCPYLS